MTAEIIDLGPMLADVRFTCQDCGSHVITVAPADTVPVCACCRFVRSIDDPDERERIRETIQCR